MQYWYVSREYRDQDDHLKESASRASNTMLCRRLHLEDVDGPFMAQEGIPAMRTTVRAQKNSAPTTFQYRVPKVYTT